MGGIYLRVELHREGFASGACAAFFYLDMFLLLLFFKSLLLVSPVHRLVS